ncbi:thiol peroxidase [Vibrio harveyi]|nr:thiol peroxidase [Vibrio harveyi]
MSNVKFLGQPVSLEGTFPEKGTPLPSVVLCSSKLATISFHDLLGKKVLLNIFPSIDTPVCANSVRAFNEKVASLPNTTVLCISADLPFAAGRFCEIEKIANVQHASLFRDLESARELGVLIADGALKNLAARAVIVVDEHGIVTYSELVDEITNEPNYDAAMKALEA